MTQEKVNSGNRTNRKLSTWLLCLLPASLLLGTNVPLGNFGGRIVYVGTNELVIGALLIVVVTRHPFHNATLSASAKVLRAIALFSVMLPVSVMAAFFKTGEPPALGSLIEILRWFEYLSILFIVATLLRSTSQLKWILRVMCFCIVVLIIVALYQAAVFDVAEARVYALFQSAADREGVSIANANTLGVALMSSSLAFFSFALASRPPIRKWLYCLLAMNLMALIFTLSRAAVLSFLVGAFVLIASAPFPKKRILLGICLSLVVFAGLVFSVGIVRSRLMNSLDPTSTTVEVISYAQRFDALLLVIQEFPKNPWLGVGYGAFERAFGGLTGADDYYLYLLATTGLGGLAAASLMFWRVFRRTLSSLRRGGPRFLPLRMAYVAILVGFLTNSLFGDFLLNPRLAGLFWLTTALVFQTTRFDSAAANAQGARLDSGSTGFSPRPRPSLTKKPIVETSVNNEMPADAEPLNTRG